MPDAEEDNFIHELRCKKKCSEQGGLVNENFGLSQSNDSSVGDDECDGLLSDIDDEEDHVDGKPDTSDAEKSDRRLPTVFAALLNKSSVSARP